MIKNEKHITTAEIEAYIKGEMTMKDVNLLEKHVQDCGFCNDALEGIELMAVPKISNQVKVNLKSKINKRINHEPNKFLMPVGQLIGIAASLLLILSISYFLIHQSLHLEKNTSISAVNSEEILPESRPNQDSTLIMSSKVDEKPLANKIVYKSKHTHLDLKSPRILADEISVNKSKIIDEKISFKIFEEEKIDVVLNEFTEDNSAKDKKLESIEVITRLQKEDSESKIFQPENINLISGFVASKNGEVLPGASISIKGLNAGATTDANGNFILQNVKIGQILVVSFVGMLPVEVKVQKANQSFKIILEEDNTTLSEIVVTASNFDARPNRMIEPVMGWNEFKKYIKSNIKYPEDAINNQIKGKVVLGIEVTNNGTVVAITLLRKLGYGCDEESLRLLKDVQWLPAFEEGEKVRSTIRIAVKF